MLGGWLVRMKGGSNSSSHSQPYLVLQVAPFRSSRTGRLGEDQLLSGELLRDSDVTMASRRPDQAHDSMAELRASHSLAVVTRRLVAHCKALELLCR